MYTVARRVCTSALNSSYSRQPIASKIASFGPPSYQVFVFDAEAEVYNIISGWLRRPSLVDCGLRKSEGGECERIYIQL
jgi:hypothetical protein